MDKNTLSSRLSRIEEELPKLSNTISAMKITDTGAYGKNYEELSLDAAQRAERIACSLRNLIFAANLVAKPLLMEKTAEVHGIAITHAADRVEITLPGLMPKRTRRVNTTFLTDPLYASLEAYTKEHPLPHFTECVVCFSHVFDRTLSTRRVRDYDNLECKQILDTVSGFLMTDDSVVVLRRLPHHGVRGAGLYRPDRYGENGFSGLACGSQKPWQQHIGFLGYFSRNFPTMVKRLPNPQNLRQIPCPRPPAFYRSFRRVW